MTLWHHKRDELDGIVFWCYSSTIYVRTSSCFDSVNHCHHVLIFRCSPYTKPSIVGSLMCIYQIMHAVIYIYMYIYILSIELDMNFCNLLFQNLIDRKLDFLHEHVFFFRITCPYEGKPPVNIYHTTHKLTSVAFSTEFKPSGYREAQQTLHIEQITVWILYHLE